MESSMEVFNSPAFGKVQVINRNGEPWFVAKDVCDCLGLTNTTMALADLEEDEKCELKESLCSGRKPLIVSEPGLYSLIIRSRKPEAKAFKRWITHEVIPTIRRSGGYSMTSTPALPPDYASALRALADNVEQKALVESRLAIAAPKAEVYDNVMADKEMSVASFARRLKGVSITSVKNDLWRLGYLYKVRGPHRIHSQYRDTYFAEKMTPYGTPEVILLDKGKQLLTKLYMEGKLTMRKGFKGALEVDATEDAE